MREQPLTNLHLPPSRSRASPASCSFSFYFIPLQEIRNPQLPSLALLHVTRHENLIMIDRILGRRREPKERFRSYRDWHCKTRYDPYRPQRTTGPRSLADMAIHVVSANIREVSKAHLALVPNRLWWRIWRYLEEERSVPMYLMELESGPNFKVTETVPACTPGI